MQKHKKGDEISIPSQKTRIISANVKKNERNYNKKARKPIILLEKKNFSKILNKSIRTIYEDLNESLDQTRLSSNLTNNMDKVNMKLNDSNIINFEENLEENLDFDEYMNHLFKLHRLH